MNKNLFGVRSMSIEHSMNEATTINLELIARPGYNAQAIYDERNWDDLFPGSVIVRCIHCGQWAARKTACKYCGAPID